MFNGQNTIMMKIPGVLFAGLSTMLIFLIQPGDVMSASQVAATLADLNPVHRNVMIITRRHHCLDANKAQIKNGTKVQFSKCHGKAHQRWTLSKGGYLVSQHTRVRKCLSAPINLLSKGTALRLWDCQNVAGQRWFHKKGRLYLFFPKKGLCFTTRSGRVERNGDAAVLGSCRTRGGMVLKLASKMPLPLKPVQLRLKIKCFMYR
jgi:hypothetical protein